MSEHTLAIYPGSFDPITYGHLDIIQRAAAVFPRLIVAVLHNPHKKSLFSFDERILLIKEVLGHMPNVKIDGFEGLLADYVRPTNAKIIVRGLRAISDFEYEFQMALTNKKICPDVETVFMMSGEQYSYISSRLIKEISMLGGDVSHFVPSAVNRELLKKLRK